MSAYVGIDVGRANHAFCVVDQDGTKLASGKFAATREGFEVLLVQLRARSVECIGMEATGHYWCNLYAALCAVGYRCCVINPVATQYYRRMSLTRHKTDLLDAECIARYLAAVRPAGEGPSVLARERLKALSRAQAEAATALTAAVNMLHHLIDLTWPELPGVLSDLQSARALALLDRYPTAAQAAGARALARLGYGERGHQLGKQLAERLKASAKASLGHAQDGAHALLVRQAVGRIRLLQAQQADLTRAIERELLAEDKALSLLVSVPGLAVRSAATILSELTDIHAFAQPRQLVGYVGAHPRLHESGAKAAHPRMSHAGNKRLRRMLWMCTIVAIRFNPIVRAHYEAKIKQGKRKMVAIGHCMHKLIRIIWAVLTYEEPFDPEGGKRLAQLKSRSNRLELEHR